MKIGAILALLSLVSISAAATNAAATAKPNIVFILADDLGWADLAFHGGNAPTPNLDQLVRTGLELTQNYSAATCSPTRARRSALLALDFPTRQGKKRRGPCWRSGGWIRRVEGSRAEARPTACPQLSSSRASRRLRLVTGSVLR